MCVNCNLLAPVQHDICDLLGIPRNVYGVASNGLDVLSEVHSKVRVYREKVEDQLHGHAKLLHDYLVERAPEILRRFVGDGMHGVVDHSFVNFVCVKNFEVEWTNEPEVVDTFKVPLELLTTDPARLRRVIGRVAYRQVELIPEELVKRYKIRADGARDYGIVMLPGQTYYADQPQ
jgi:hypothetical protein